MKPPLNNETKARFYYTYGVIDPYERGFPVPVKNLADISDEDLSGCDFVFPHGREGIEIAFVGDGSWIGYRHGVQIDSGHLLIKHIDFLRSRGYLVPFMGLSCEEIIEAGWAKYVEG